MEGPRNADEFESDYSQLHRMAIYNEALEQLAHDGLVFACTCSRRELGGSHGHACNCFTKHIPLNTPEVNWRLITDNHELAVRGYDGEIIPATLPADMHNFVVRKKDGMPSYQLACVMDDLFYGVDLIVRGKDLWPSTLAQYALAKALKNDNFNNISFYHHSLAMGATGKKLSKSAGATSVRYLRQNGETPTDIFTRAATMIGVREPIKNWQQLARFFLQCHG